MSRQNLKGWLVYNGSKEVEKVNLLIDKVLVEAKNKGYALQGIKSTEILACYDNKSLPKLTSLEETDEPDYVLFWDKDFYLAKHLEMLGYRVFNTSRAIEICDNKVLMHQAFAKSNLRVPKTILGPFAFFENKLDKSYYDFIVDQIGEDFILKEAFGSFGMQVYMVNSFEKFTDLIKEIGNKRFIMQENIKSSRGRDLRINIIGDQIIGAMERKNPNDFRANISSGGQGFPVEITDQQGELALKAHKLLGLDFSGVDLLYGRDDEPILCEVNSNVNFLSYENTSGITIGDKLLAYIEETIEK